LGFSERINTIFLILNCSNARLARASGIDASLVSRYRTGGRTPKAGSTQFENLCKGIISYAEENCLWEELKDACQLADSGKSEDEIRSYLIPQNTMKREKINNRPKQNNFCFSGEKLNALMNILGISNIRLAKALNVDSSLISRLRNGFRTPSKNSPLTINLCNYFCKRVLAGGFEKEFSELLCIPKSIVVNGDEELMKHFVDWLTDKSDMQNTSAMDRFLEKLSSFTININHPLPSVDSIATYDIINDCISIYTGIDGLRRAVLRFLGSVAVANHPCTLKLYSDQSMDWLTSDTDFSQKWSILMVAVLLKKNPIRIIHNIDRSLPEMLAAIENWLPLYMTGMITSFYCKRAVDNRFSHTLFVAPSLAAINATLVAGTENSGKYQYITSEENITYYETQFNALMDVSKPLVKVFIGENIADYHFYLGEMAKYEGKTMKILSSLSLATMPKNLLEKILIRNEVSQTDRDKILLLHETSIRQFEKELQSGSVIEYIPLPKEESFLSGMVALNLTNLFLIKSISYTSEEYSEHICAVISLLCKNNNYNYVPLSSNSFENIQIILKSDIGVVVLKSDTPAASFCFGHPMMCQAFVEYLDTIIKRSGLAIHNRNDLISFLRKYTL
jgi:transcriptional regulator with XRE-family HTH domain